MKKIIIFGIGKISQVVYYYFSRCPNLKVCGFTVDREYLQPIKWTNLPIIDFEQVQERFSPGEYEMFVSLGYQKLNSFRANRVLEAKNKGYSLFSYIDPNAAVPEDFKYGENCLVMPNQNIQPCVSIGHNVFVWSGVTIGHHSRIEDNCWLTSTSNIAGNVVVGKNCFLGMNTTLVDSVCIGQNCLLGASVLVTKSLPDESVVIDKGTEVNRLSSSQFLKLSSRMNG